MDGLTFYRLGSSRPLFYYLSGLLFPFLLEYIECLYGIWHIASMHHFIWHLCIILSCLLCYCMDSNIGSLILGHFAAHQCRLALPFCPLAPSCACRQISPVAGYSLTMPSSGIGLSIAVQLDKIPPYEATSKENSSNSTRQPSGC